MEIQGRHWVFILGFITTALVALYNTEVAVKLVELLFCIGIGIMVRDKK